MLISYCGERGLNFGQSPFHKSAFRIYYNQTLFVLGQCLFQMWLIAVESRRRVGEMLAAVVRKSSHGLEYGSRSGEGADNLL